MRPNLKKMHMLLVLLISITIFKYDYVCCEMNVTNEKNKEIINEDKVRNLLDSVYNKDSKQEESFRTLDKGKESILKTLIDVAKNDTTGRKLISLLLLADMQDIESSNVLRENKDYLISEVKNIKSDKRQLACIILLKTKDIKLQSLIIELLKDNDESIRTGSALFLMRNADESAVKDVFEACKKESKDYVFVEICLSTLARIGSKQAIADLFEICKGNKIDKMYPVLCRNIPYKITNKESYT